jgi:hypothetical protein
MLWEKKALAARGSGSSEKKSKKYEKQVYYGSPLDPEAFAVAEANRAAAAAARNNTVFSDLKAFLSSPKARLKLDPQNHLYFLRESTGLRCFNPAAVLTLSWFLASSSPFSVFWS